MSAKKKIADNLICDVNKLTSDKWHFLNKPYKLPCSRTVCFKCFNDLIKPIDCIFCKHKHNQNDLIRNRLIELEIEDNSNLILEFYLNEFERKSKNLLQSTNDLTKTINEKCTDFIQEDIDIRIESLKCELDKLEFKLYEKIDQRVTNFKNPLGKDNILLDDNILIKFLNEVLFKRKLNRSEMDDINENMFGTLQLPIFNDYQDKGYERLIKLNNIYPFDLIEYNSTELLVTSPVNNSIFKLLNYKCIEIIKKIENETLVNPTSICMNLDRTFIFICIKRKILCTNYKLNQLKYILDEKSTQQLVNPCDIYINDVKNCLIILDYTSSMDLLIFDCKKEVFCNRIQFGNNFKTTEIRQPFCISMNNLNYIAVNLDKKSPIKIFKLADDNLNLFLDSEIIIEDDEEVEINSLYFNSSLMKVYVHLNNKIVGYKYDELEKKWYLTFEKKFSNHNNYCNELGSWKMKLINDNCLALCLWGQQILII